MPADVPRVALGLQGGGSHGAFTWGVLDRLLEDVAAGRLALAAISGASSGAVNAALCASGLAADGAGAARARLRAFWEGLSRRGYATGNSFFGFADPAGIFGFNIDWSPAAIMLEAAGLVVSPYTNPFYVDFLTPLLRQSFPAAELERLNRPDALRLFLSATNVHTNARTIFSQPDISVDVLRASACLPTEFKAVQLGHSLYWDGGYLGNPPLDPLLDIATDLLLVLINPFHYDPTPPFTARQILDRLNQITFNASVVLEMNAIAAINRAVGAAGGSLAKPGGGEYQTVHLHLIRNDRFMESLGFVSKLSTSWALIESLFENGR
ncbi:MAG: patatin-like phospholipase family protein, partial [Acetobacteraceae bacterium]